MATTTNSGQNFQIRNITLNSTTDTPIDFSQQVNSILMRSRTSVDVYVRRTSGAADYFTIPTGGTLSLDVAMTDNSQGGNVVCYARSASGSPILEVLGTY